MRSYVMGDEKLSKILKNLERHPENIKLAVRNRKFRLAMWKRVADLLGITSKEEDKVVFILKGEIYEMKASELRKLIHKKQREASER